MSERSFSVIIPTRERADTLAAALRSVTNQSYDNLEIIVSDNSSRDNTREIVCSFDDQRIKYINTGRRLSMSQNWEFALNHATGNWITVIGDDDALLPNCLAKVNQIVDATGVEAIRSSTCSYHWPGKEDSTAGTLTVPMAKGYSVRLCQQWMMKVLLGKESYPTLPMLYNGGFISNKAIRGAQFGDTFFRSCIPDVYSAVALSNTLTRYVYSFEPLAINGASKHSTGTSQFSKKPKQDGPSQKFLQEGNIPFHPSIPMDDDGGYPKSIQAMIYESCSQAAAILPNIASVDPATQLLTILTTSGSHHESLQRWGRRFARLHGIDFNYISTSADRCVSKHKQRQIVGRLKTFADVEFTSRKHPIDDVFQASLIAGEVIQSRPSPLFRMARRLTGKLSRSLCRAA